MQQINKIAQPFPEILALCCLGMPNHTQQILHDLTKASMDISLYVKNEHYASNRFWYIKV